MHRRSVGRSVGRSRIGARTRVRAAHASELSGYHSFALERAARALLMTVPWNYCGTSRPAGKVRAVKAEKRARARERGREEKVNPTRDIPTGLEDYFLPFRRG